MARTVEPCGAVPGSRCSISPGWICTSEKTRTERQKKSVQMDQAGTLPLNTHTFKSHVHINMPVYMNSACSHCPKQWVFSALSSAWPVTEVSHVWLEDSRGENKWESTEYIFNLSWSIYSWIHSLWPRWLNWQESPLSVGLLSLVLITWVQLTNCNLKIVKEKIQKRILRPYNFHRNELI